MPVTRIVANIHTDRIAEAKAFYAGVLGLEIAIDLGWIVTFAGPRAAQPQLSVAVEGGSGTQVPDLSVEVDDFDETLARVMAAGIPVEYGPTREPWGVRRFFVRDPAGRLVNILQHA